MHNTNRQTIPTLLGSGKYSKFAVSVEDGLWRKLTAEEFYGKPIK